jgi:hypothetical protein
MKFTRDNCMHLRACFKLLRCSKSRILSKELSFPSFWIGPPLKQQMSYIFVFVSDGSGIGRAPASRKLDLR